MYITKLEVFSQLQSLDNVRKTLHAQRYLDTWPYSDDGETDQDAAQGGTGGPSFTKPAKQCAVILPI
jgi:hypothetical protein